MTNGTIAIIRLSAIAVVQVVHPRLDPPATTKPSTFAWPPSALAQNAVTVSIARTADLVQANLRLREEIATRQHAEQELRQSGYLLHRRARYQERHEFARA